MKESELRMIFMQISNRYPSFAYDDFKVNDWLGLLSSVPISQASENLKKYCLNPDNSFPPHPGVLAATSSQQISGRAIPNAKETSLMLENRHRLALATRGLEGIPEKVIEEVRNIGTKLHDRRIHE